MAKEGDKRELPNPPMRVSLMLSHLLAAVCIMEQDNRVQHSSRTLSETSSSIPQPRTTPVLLLSSLMRVWRGARAMATDLNSK